MPNIIIIFLLSLVLSLTLTPKVGWLARKYKIVDKPSGRKVHTRPIPRIGGLAICLAFYFTFILVFIFETGIFNYNPESQVIFLFIGGLIAFGLGLWDDIKGLSPSVKIVFQALAALAAYIGDVRIAYVGLPGMQDWYMGWISLPASVFWVILVMNAINLIDGLDGLAAGVSFFVCMVLIVLCTVTERPVIAVMLAALAGSILGFLRYNFNPASIFMGDGGSYFLGYMLATLSMLGAIKSQATVSILIPIIALGLPLMDALWAPIRRFILGQKLFYPDKDHLHHRLLKLGFTHRHAVLAMYGVTIGMGILSLMFVYGRDDRTALILIFVAMSIIFGIRKLGYLEYFAIDKVYGWLKDVTDEVGITHERRSFLNLQVEISQSGNMEDLWTNICRALDRLKFDMSEMHLEHSEIKNQKSKNPQWVWTNNGFDINKDVCKDCLMKLELPLLDHENKTLGTLWLIKDLRRNSIGHYTLRRVEHLRRTVMATLKRLEQING
ncbi:MAG: undecaprenyl/decaprenyl-phosphate alpha-N-acetylglucosaminyl 1-phosphate transferase [Desulfobacteraceae bacterium]|nr:undecaprenyl/decaprenyl-phosphate alpha-N-acetylglucosaminyl 1-phosphate transferase [Desulfobacteraceae bacterium]